jgi:hypothetical protein
MAGTVTLTPQPLHPLQPLRLNRLAPIHHPLRSKPVAHRNANKNPVFTRLVAV